MKHISILGILSLLIGCAVIPPSQGIYNGNLSYERGYYQQAKESYESALELAIQQNYKPHIATANYGIGRSQGQLCNFELAEKHLKEAVNIEESISGGKGVHLSQDYFELARLYYDYGKFKESAIYFSKALPVAEQLGIEKSDPIGYAHVLKDYAMALDKNNNKSEAALIKEKIENLIFQNPGRTAGFIATRFNSACTP